MLKEQFHYILDQLTKWKMSAHQTYYLDRNRKAEDNDPESGYEVVYSYNVKEHDCEWCDQQCRNHKTYRRYITPKDNCNWTGKCHDCGTIRQFPYKTIK